jgi:hypothetical protein
MSAALTPCRFRPFIFKDNSCDDAALLNVYSLHMVIH